jgi:hypothetical protein
MATKKPDDLIPDTGRGRKGEPERLKIEGSWESVAKKLLSPKPQTPARQVKPRKSAKPKS